MQNLTNALRKHILIAFVLIIGTGTSVFAAPWDLDLTFGNGGKVLWSPNGNTVSALGGDIAIQTDGKIVMAGGIFPTAQSGFIVVRFNTDGTLDTSFNAPNGWVGLDFGGNGDTARSVAIQPDGKIVAGGNTSSPGQSFAFARLNPDGSLDPTFHFDGMASYSFVDFQGLAPAILNKLRIAPDGKIIAVGQGGPQNTFSYKTLVARLLPDGNLDTTFDTDGRVMDVYGTGGWSDVAVNSDGSMVVAGYSSSQATASFSIRKFNNDGGIAWTVARGAQAACGGLINGVVAQPDGKYVVVGTDACKPFLIRINPDGSGDNTFSSTPPSFGGQASSVAIQPDGKLLTMIRLGSSSAIARFSTDGTADVSWGTGGLGPANFQGSGRAILLQQDGKILVGGYAGQVVPFSFSLARYLGTTSAVAVQSLFDYDDDGKSDVSVFRPSENKWYIFRSSDSMITQQVFAIAGDIPVPADYDGDGKTDIAIYRPSNGAWWYLSSINNNQINVNWGGEAGDIPRPSDFDGDGKTDFVFFRPTNNFWYRINSAGTVSNVQFGLTGDKPVRGDFDGDGKWDVAIYRPSTGDWWYQSSVNNAQLAVKWGISTDIPAPADFDGDGKTDFAVYRPSTGVWYIINSSNGSFTIGAFGISEDKPVPADFDGDGKADIAVFRPSTGIWYMLRSTSGFGATQWGISTDIPTENAFVPQ